MRGAGPRDGPTPSEQRSITDDVHRLPNGSGVIGLEWRPSGRSSGGISVAKFVIYADSTGKYRWKLVSSNGQTTASSGESFASKSNAREAAESVKKSAGSADVVDE